MGGFYSGLNFGNFGQHVVFRNPGGIVPFGSHPVDIVLDAPNFVFGTVTAFDYLATKLRQAATSRGLPVAVTPRPCSSVCLCQDATRNGYVAAVVTSNY